MFSQFSPFLFAEEELTSGRSWDCESLDRFCLQQLSFDFLSILSAVTFNLKELELKAFWWRWKRFKLILVFDMIIFIVYNNLELVYLLPYLFYCREVQLWPGLLGPNFVPRLKRQKIQFGPKLTFRFQRRWNSKLLRSKPFKGVFFLNNIPIFWTMICKYWSFLTMLQHWSFLTIFQHCSNHYTFLETTKVQSPKR